MLTFNTELFFIKGNGRLKWPPKFVILVSLYNEYVCNKTKFWNFSWQYHRHGPLN